MIIILLAVLVLAVAVLWGVGRLSRTKPDLLRRLLKSSGGIAILALAAFLLLRGQLEIALGLGAFGLGLLGWSGMSGVVGGRAAASRVDPPPSEADFDRLHPGWREDAHGHTAAGRGSVSSGKMSEQEAYQILGLQPGASATDITNAHRSLIKKLHPDQGGSTYLAARVNEAKEILARKHRR